MDQESLGATETIPFFDGFFVDWIVPVGIASILAILWGAWVVRMFIYLVTVIREMNKPLTDAQGNTTTEKVGLKAVNKMPESGQTLDIPKGAVRVFFVLLFSTIGLVAIFADGFVAAEDKKWVLGELTVVIAFYFVSKVADKSGEQEKKNQEAAINSDRTPDEISKIVQTFKS